MDGAKPGTDPSRAKNDPTKPKGGENGKPSTAQGSQIAGGKKSAMQPVEKRSSASLTSVKPTNTGGSGFGSMFGKPGASRPGRPAEHAPSTMRMNPLPRPEVDDQEDDGGDHSSGVSSARTGLPRSLPPVPPQPKLHPLALPDSKRSAPPPSAARSDAAKSVVASSAAAAAAAGMKRPLDMLRLPNASAPSVVPGTLSGSAVTVKDEERPGGAKRRRRGNGPLSVSWASQLTDVREYIPNPEEWGRSPRHLHGDEFSDAVRYVMGLLAFIKDSDRHSEAYFPRIGPFFTRAFLRCGWRSWASGASCRKTCPSLKTSLQTRWRLCLRMSPPPRFLHRALVGRARRRRQFVWSGRERQLGRILPPGGHPPVRA